jgi:hypothetical protein
MSASTVGIKIHPEQLTGLFMCLGKTRTHGDINLPPGPSVVDISDLQHCYFYYSCYFLVFSVSCVRPGL